MRADRGTNATGTTAPPARCAMTVRTDEARLRTRNGVFSTIAERKVQGETTRLRGNQSRMRSTNGRVTAIGLLRSARMKRPSVQRYGLLATMLPPEVPL